MALPDAVHRDLDRGVLVQDAADTAAEVRRDAVAHRGAVDKAVRAAEALLRDGVVRARLRAACPEARRGAADRADLGAAATVVRDAPAVFDRMAGHRPGAAAFPGAAALLRGAAPAAPVAERGRRAPLPGVAEPAGRSDESDVFAPAARLAGKLLPVARWELGARQEAAQADGSAYEREERPERAEPVQRARQEAQPGAQVELAGRAAREPSRWAQEPAQFSAARPERAEPADAA